MPIANLTGVRAKIERSKYHLNQLNAAITAWGSAREEAESSVLNYQPGGKRLDLTLRQVEPNDLKWALIVGDIVHNLRSALDHLVYQLALLNGKPTTCSNKTAFPICIDAPSFAKASKRVRPYVHPRAFALIEELQPYVCANLVGKDPKTSNLWIISELDIIDKHRMLVIAGKYFRTTDVSYSVNDGAPASAPINNAWCPLVDGAPIASVDFSSFDLKEKDKMHVSAQMEVQIFFNETGTGCDGLELQAALEPCIRYVSDIVELFDRQFFK